MILCKIGSKNSFSSNLRAISAFFVFQFSIYIFPSFHLKLKVSADYSIDYDTFPLITPYLQLKTNLCTLFCTNICFDIKN